MLALLGWRRMHWNRFLSVSWVVVGVRSELLRATVFIDTGFYTAMKLQQSAFTWPHFRTLLSLLLHQGRIQEKMWPVSKRVSAEGASRLGGSGGMFPRKILSIWLSKTLFPAFSGLKFDNIMYLSSDLHKCKCKCRQTFTRVNSRSVFQGFAPRPESGNYQIPKFWPVSVNRCKLVWIRACT